MTTHFHLKTLMTSPGNIKLCGNLQCLVVDKVNKVNNKFSLVCFHLFEVGHNNIENFLAKAPYNLLTNEISSTGLHDFILASHMK